MPEPGQLEELRAAGDRLQRRAGTPQDVEWAFDHDGRLWLLQSRPITTLFPVPTSSRPEPRVYLEVGHMQGMLRPFTPMGMSAMRVATAQSFRSLGIPADPFEGHPGVVAAAGRMYLDLTGPVRNRTLRRRLPAALQIYGPRVSTAMTRVLDDPRFAAVPGRPYRLRTVIAVAVRIGPGLIVGLAGAILRPARARVRAFRAAAEVQRTSRPPEELSTAADRLRFAIAVQGAFTGPGMLQMLSPIYAAMFTRAAAVALLADVATSSEIDETLRGMPHNVTTEINLDLWRLASAAREHRDLLMHTPPAELAARYRAGDLPEIWLDGFLARYGHRGAAEIDVGVPRWAEDSTGVRRDRRLPTGHRSRAGPRTGGSPGPPRTASRRSTSWSRGRATPDRPGPGAPASSCADPARSPACGSCPSSPGSTCSLRCAASSSPLAPSCTGAAC